MGLREGLYSAAVTGERLLRLSPGLSEIREQGARDRLPGTGTTATSPLMALSASEIRNSPWVQA